jgi:hypothetical protein
VIKALLLKKNALRGKSNRVNRCGAPVSAPLSSVFARLASGVFYKTIVPLTSYEIINISGLKVDRWVLQPCGRFII